MYHVILLIVLFFICCLNGFAQQDSRICITFEKDSKYIDMITSKDSSLIAFNILKGPYETKKQAKAAKKEYYSKNAFNRIQPPPSFYIVFYSNQNHKKIESLDEITGCALMLDLDTYRNFQFKYPEGVGDSKVYLVQKHKSEKLLKWSVIMMAYE